MGAPPNLFPSIGGGWSTCVWAPGTCCRREKRRDAFSQVAPATSAAIACVVSENSGALREEQLQDRCAPGLNNMHELLT